MLIKLPESKLKHETKIFLSALAMSIINLVKGDPVMVIIAVAGSACYYLYAQQRAFKSQLFLVSGIIGIFVFCWIGLWTSPAQAQFFIAAEEFFSDSEGLAIDEGTISLIFLTIRAVFLLYLVIAFLNVFNSVRQDDDWLQAARTPALVVLFVTAADFLTQFIIGGGSGG
ncbi:MAG: hypothetical protein EA365_14085 [Gloeocapsa sp. DLM2.Bin57]|nr:MAG: hypothetical protein EA365_14085 [Gloeocapsa sp. DLM2.Bin57]